MAGQDCLGADTKECEFSLILFDITDVVAAQSDIEWEVPPGETFGKLLRNHFPAAESIAYLGREDFCVLQKYDKNFDEQKAISRLCEDSRDAIYADAAYDSFSAYVGRIDYDAEKYSCVDDMLQDADELFFKRERQPSPDVPQKTRAGEALGRWRKTIF